MSRFDLPTPEQTAAVDHAITSRHSLRAFLPTPVPRQTLEDILAVASRAPSGTNTQPWQVHVLTGAALKRVSSRIQAAYLDPEQNAAHREEYAYYPTEWRSPYIDRRRKVGWDLYGLLGIAKTDKARMQQQHGRNFIFFDAPVGLFFTIDRVMQQGSWLDYGMFLQNLMIAARARGLRARNGARDGRSGAPVPAPPGRGLALTWIPARPLFGGQPRLPACWPRWAAKAFSINAMHGPGRPALVPLTRSSGLRMH